MTRVEVKVQQEIFFDFLY